MGALLRSVGRSAFRPGHIHYKVTAEGHAPLTTMVFMAGDRWLASDAVWAVKDQLVVKLEELTPGQHCLTFDVTLAAISGVSGMPRPSPVAQPEQAAASRR